MQIRTLAASLALVSSLGLVACGGGGGGSSTSSSDTSGTGGTSVTTTAVTITESNMSQVGQAAVEQATGQASTVAAGASVIGVQANDPQPLSQFSARLLTRAAMRALADVDTSAQVTGAETTQSVSCAEGGTISVTFTDTNSNNKLDAGDSVKTSFNACKELGATLSGSMTMAVNSLSGTLSSGTATLGFTSVADNLSVTLPSGKRSTTSGTLTFSARQTSTTTFTATVTASNLNSKTYDASGNLVNDVTTTSATVTVVEGTSSVTVGLSETLTGTWGTRFSGTLTLATLTGQELLFNGSVYPSSGVLVATGNGSKVVATFLSGGYVKLDLDKDNNGTVDKTVTMTVAELLTL